MADTDQPQNRQSSTQQSPMVCNGCGLVCDDILFNRGPSDLQFGNACQKGEQHLRGRLSSEKNASDFESAWADAAKNAARILSNARYPLVAGIEHLGTAAQQLAVNIAMRAGAIVDSSLNDSRSALFSLQRVGQSTATLGEVRQRADLIVFWFCDSTDSHPRLVERFCNDPGQEIISIDGDANTAADVAQTCEMLLRGIEVTGEQIPVGVDLSQCQVLVEKLKSKNYVAFFFDPEKFDPCFDAAIDSLSSLVSQLNSLTRAVTLSLRNASNSLSAENVLAWSTGFASAVSTSRNNRSHFLEYSATQVLKNKECDAALLFAGSDDSAKWIAKHIGGMSAIVVGQRVQFSSVQFSSVQFSSVQTSDTESDLMQLTGDLLTGKNDWCRMDDVLVTVEGARASEENYEGWIDRFLQLTLEQISKSSQ